MDATEPDDRQILADRMNKDRVRKQLGNWDDVARAMGLSSALLRRIRNGTAPITYESEVAIERFYAWPEGEVRRLLVSNARLTDEQILAMTFDEIGAHAARLHVRDGRPAAIAFMQRATDLHRAAADLSGDRS